MSQGCTIGCLMRAGPFLSLTASLLLHDTRDAAITSLVLYPPAAGTTVLGCTLAYRKTI